MPWHSGEVDFHKQRQAHIKNWYFIQTAIGLKHIHNNKGLLKLPYSLPPCVSHQKVSLLQCHMSLLLWHHSAQTEQAANQGTLAPSPCILHLCNSSSPQLLNPCHHHATLPASQGRGAGWVCATGSDIFYRSVSSQWVLCPDSRHLDIFFCLFILFYFGFTHTQTDKFPYDVSTSVQGIQSVITVKRYVGFICSYTALCCIWETLG